MWHGTIKVNLESNLRRSPKIKANNSKCSVGLTNWLVLTIFFTTLHIKNAFVALIRWVFCDSQYFSGHDTRSWIKLLSFANHGKRSPPIWRCPRIILISMSMGHCPPQRGTRAAERVASANQKSMAASLTKAYRLNDNLKSVCERGHKFTHWG